MCIIVSIPCHNNSWNERLECLCASNSLLNNNNNWHLMQFTCQTLNNFFFNISTYDSNPLWRTQFIYIFLLFLSRNKNLKILPTHTQNILILFIFFTVVGWRKARAKKRISWTTKHNNTCLCWNCLQFFRNPAQTHIHVLKHWCKSCVCGKWKTCNAHIIKIIIIKFNT